MEDLIPNSDLPKLIPYRKGGYWGFCDSDKNIIIECLYISVELFNEGFACVRSGDKFGLVDVNGSIKIPIEYDEKIVFINNYAILKKNDKYSFIDRNCQEISLAQYKNVGSFNEYGLCQVDKVMFPWETTGFIDKTGNVVIPIVFQRCYGFKDGFCVVQKDFKFGLIDSTGQEVISCKFDRIGSFSEGLASVKINDKWGFINRDGDIVVRCKYLEVQPFSEGLACVKSFSGKWGFINKREEEITPFNYEKAYSFSGGTACVKLNNYYGLINKKGIELTEIRYLRHFESFDEFTGPIRFYDGLALINRYINPESMDNESIVGLYGFINKQGTEVIPPQFDYATHFHEGRALVSKNIDTFNSQQGYINIKGELVVPMIYTSYSSFKEGLAPCKKNNKLGVIDKNGKTTIEFKYHGFIGGFKNGIAKIYFGQKPKCDEDADYGYIDKRGVEYWEEVKEDNDEDSTISIDTNDLPF